MGALFFCGFGSAWLVLHAIESFEHPGWMIAAVAAMGSGLFVLALRRYRQLRPALKAQADSPARQRTTRLFHAVNAVQWVAILVVGNLLANIGLSVWVIPAVIFIVGLHFLPLAQLFANRPHILTGAALMLLAVIYPLLAPAGPASPVGCLGAGVILWASALRAVKPGPVEAAHHVAR
jgi:hypothetical protein